MASAAMGMTMMSAMSGKMSSAVPHGLPGTAQDAQENLRKCGGILSYARAAVVEPSKMAHEILKVDPKQNSAVMKAAAAFTPSAEKAADLTSPAARSADLDDVSRTYGGTLDLIDRISLKAFRRATNQGKVSFEGMADRLEGIAHRFEAKGNLSAAHDIMTRACHHDAAARLAPQDRGREQDDQTR